MKKTFLILTIVVLASMLLAMPASAAKKQPPSGLTPGQYTEYTQTVPVNLVFIGYSPTVIDTAALVNMLPNTYEPVVRYPEMYGIDGRPMGLHFDFTYRPIFSNKKFDDKFFRYLTRIGEAGEPTDYQLAYNEMASNVQDVTGPVLYLDAPSVEKYLAKQARSLGINKSQRGYTIYFINWYSRPDFQYHVYSKTDTLDPDTDYNFGAERASRKTIAWGGSYHRGWFYDLSAGPEAWTDNWEVDHRDLSGNGFEDYRMPAIWEYTEGGYRHPSVLSTDLGLVARYVGINLLFTTSPLYDPLVAAPGLDGKRISHIEMFEDDPNSYGGDWLDLAFVNQRLSNFQPYYAHETYVEDNDPIDAAAQRSLLIFGEQMVEDDCWNDYGDTFAQLFCYFDMNYANYVPGYGETDYVAPVFAFNTTMNHLGVAGGLLGFADDNWMDGTQSYVFAFDTPDYRETGYGFSTTAVHETGHHIGLSHPHDGFDSELGLDYGPEDDYYFAWSGDESHSIMHYMDLSDEFGQFDRDNMYRYEFAGYMNWSNELYASVLADTADPNYRQVRALLKKAGKRSLSAVKYFNRWDYLKAARDARETYQLLLRSAVLLDIPWSPEERIMRPPSGAAPHQGDPIRFPDN